MKCIFRQTLRFNSCFVVFFALVSVSSAIPLKEKKQEPIVITSSTALCKKNNNEMVITYKDNVSVAIPQKGTITAQTLEIVLNAPSFSKKEMSMNDCKSIQLCGNVELLHENNKARADSVDLFLENNECILKGNVQLEQKENPATPIPLKTECQQAKINLASWSISLEGNSDLPVKTVLSLTPLKHHDTLTKHVSNTVARPSKVVVHAKNKNSSA